MESVTSLTNPLVKRDITILRDKATGQKNFREALDRIGYALALECGLQSKTEIFNIETPLEETSGYRLAENIFLIPVLRAGLSLVEPFLTFFPNASVGIVGLSRNEKTLEPEKYYQKFPRGIEKGMTIILDPMLATGGSACETINLVKKAGSQNIIFVSVVAAPEGIDTLNSRHKDVKLFTAVIDRELNDAGFILPGLGDAGDRIFGTL